MSVRTALKQRLEPEPQLDTHPETRLDFDQVRLAARQGYDRPVLLVDPADHPHQGPALQGRACRACSRTTR